MKELIGPHYSAAVMLQPQRLQPPVPACSPRGDLIDSDELLGQDRHENWDGAWSFTRLVELDAEGGAWWVLSSMEQSPLRPGDDVGDGQP